MHVVYMHCAAVTPKIEVCMLCVSLVYLMCNNTILLVCMLCVNVSSVYVVRMQCVTMCLVYR